MTSTAEKTLRILAEVADTPRLPEEFGVDISPAEFERKDWAAPAILVQDMERRAGP